MSRPAHAARRARKPPCGRRTTPAAARTPPVAASFQQHTKLLIGSSMAEGTAILVSAAPKHVTPLVAAFCALRSWRHQTHVRSNELAVDVGCAVAEEHHAHARSSSARREGVGARALGATLSVGVFASAALHGAAPWCRNAARRGHLAQSKTRRRRQRRRKAPVLAAPHAANIRVAQRAPAAPPFAHAPPGASSAPSRYAVCAQRPRDERATRRSRPRARAAGHAESLPPPTKARGRSTRDSWTLSADCITRARAQSSSVMARGGRRVVTSLRPVPPRCEPTWRTARRRRRRATSCARCVTGAPSGRSGSAPLCFARLRHPAAAPPRQRLTRGAAQAAAAHAARVVGRVPLGVRAVCSAPRVARRNHAAAGSRLRAAHARGAPPRSAMRRRSASARRADGAPAQAETFLPARSEAALALAMADARVDAAKTWFWRLRAEDAARVRALQAERAVVAAAAGRADADWARHVRAARKQLGVWSDAGVREARKQFWCVRRAPVAVCAAARSSGACAAATRRADWRRFAAQQARV